MLQIILKTEKHLDEVTSARFSIVKEAEADTSVPSLVTGNSALAKSLLPQVDANQLLYDGTVVETADHSPTRKAKSIR